MKTEFRIGDKVVCINNKNEPDLVLHKEYTIKHMVGDEYGYYYILFDEYNGRNEYRPERFVKTEEFIQILRSKKIKTIKDKIENKGVKNKFKNFFKGLLK